MSRYAVFGGVLAWVLAIAGCGQGNERLAEKASIEGKAQLQAQYEVQAQKSQEMEEDLTARHRFYQAVRGIYEGTMTNELGEVRVKIQLVPSLPPYAANRVRQLEEISYDLNNLYFNAQVILWNPADPLSAVGCRVEQIRPDLESGQINIASQACSNVYTLRISAGSPAGAASSMAVADNAPSRVSSEIAASIRDGRLSRVNALEGEIHPTTNAAVYRVSATRTQ